MTKLNQSKVLIIATNGFQEDELFSPREYLMEHGADVHLASPEMKEISAGEGDNRKIKPDMMLSDVNVDDYDALVLPGGLANPDTLRINDDVKRITAKFTNDGKVVAAICHGPWILIDAGVAQGRTMTSYPTIQTDLKNAGATWVDEEVVVSNGIITSRSPKDLDAFNAKIAEEIREGIHKRENMAKAA